MTILRRPATRNSPAAPGCLGDPFASPVRKVSPTSWRQDVGLRRQSKFETHADGECRVERSERRCHEVEPVHLLKNTRRQLACRPLELPLQLGADI
jgi:hypothetical protein